MRALLSSVARGARLTLAALLAATTVHAQLATGTASILPAPTATTLGGVESIAPLAHQYLTGVNTSGAHSQAQPQCADLSDATGFCNLSTTNGVTPSMMAQAATNTLRGNPTGSTANVQDTPVPSCSGAGNFLNWTSASGFGCKTPTFIAVAPSNPASTISTTLVMAGIGGTAAITPSATGRLRITINGTFYTSTAAAGMVIGAYYGTGTAPANGVAQTGTPIGVVQHTRPGGFSTTTASPFSISFIVTGLTVSTAYWIDLAFDTSNTADAANLQDITVVAQEF